MDGDYQGIKSTIRTGAVTDPLDEGYNLKRDKKMLVLIICRTVLGISDIGGVSEKTTTEELS